MNELGFCSRSTISANPIYICKLLIRRQLTGPETSYRAKSIRSARGQFSKTFCLFLSKLTMWLVKKKKVDNEKGMFKIKYLNKRVATNVQEKCVFSAHVKFKILLDAAFVKCVLQ